MSRVSLDAYPVVMRRLALLVALLVSLAACQPDSKLGAGIHGALPTTQTALPRQSAPASTPVPGATPTY